MSKKKNSSNSLLKFRKYPSLSRNIWNEKVLLSLFLIIVILLIILTKEYNVGKILLLNEIFTKQFSLFKINEFEVLNFPLWIKLNCFKFNKCYFLIS